MSLTLPEKWPQIRLWFFRDLTQEQRLKLIKLCGLDEDHTQESHGYQSLALKTLLSIPKDTP